MSSSLTVGTNLKLTVSSYKDFMLGRSQKIRVEIVGGAVPIKRNCEIEGNHVIILPGSKGRGGAPIKAEYDNTCLVPYYTGFPFRSIKYKLLLRYDATKCVSFGKDSSDVAPSCTPSDVARYGRATVIRLAGNIKGESRTLIYALLIIVIVLGILTLITSAGRIRF